MSKSISLGFLTPRPSRMQAGSWSVIAAGLVQPDPAIVPDWDYASDIVVQRELTIDLVGILKDCGLGRQSSVNGLICWSNTSTRLRGGARPVGLVEGRNVLNLELPGSMLGGDLALECRIVLGADPDRLNALAPRRVGSTLWSDAHRVTLEGAGSRFPTLPIAFSTAGLASGRNGLWCLTADTDDLAASGSGAIRLYLNSENEAVKKMLDEPATEQSRILADFIHFDVARQLLFRALGHEELDLRTDYEPGSVGEVLSGFVRRFFPYRDLAMLRGDMRVIPGELEAELQANVGLLT